MKFKKLETETPQEYAKRVNALIKERDSIPIEDHIPNPTRKRIKKKPRKHNKARFLCGKK